MITTIPKVLILFSGADDLIHKFKGQLERMKKFRVVFSTGFFVVVVVEPPKIQLKSIVHHFQNLD